MQGESHATEGSGHGAGAGVLQRRTQAAGHRAGRLQRPAAHRAVLGGPGPDALRLEAAGRRQPGDAPAVGATAVGALALRGRLGGDDDDPAGRRRPDDRHPDRDRGRAGREEGRARLGQARVRPHRRAGGQRGQGAARRARPTRPTASPSRPRRPGRRTSAATSRVPTRTSCASCSGPVPAAGGENTQQWGLDNDGVPGVVGADVAALAAWTITTGVAATSGWRSSTRASTRPTRTSPPRSRRRRTSSTATRTRGPTATTRTGRRAPASSCPAAPKVKGLAHGASLVAARIAKGDGGDGWIFDDFNTADAIDWCWRDGKADVLSNSWGGGVPADVITAAFRRARTRGRGGKGAVVVVAAGNAQGRGAVPRRPARDPHRRRLEPVGRAQDHPVARRGGLVGQQLRARPRRDGAGRPHPHHRHLRTPRLQPEGHDTDLQRHLVGDAASSRPPARSCCPCGRTSTEAAVRKVLCDTADHIGRGTKRRGTSSSASAGSTPTRPLRAARRL